MMTRNTHSTTLKRALLAPLFLLGALALTSCDSAPPDTQAESFSQLTYYHFADNPAELRAPLLAWIASAERTIDIALARLEDDTIADALIAGAARGVTVRVVTDEGARQDSGIQRLVAANIPIFFGDGPLTYLPDPTLTSILQECLRTPQYIQCTRREGNVNLPGDGVIVRPDEYNLMADNFAIFDGDQVWNSSTPFINAPALYMGWTARSQDLAIAFEREFQQMFGGVTSVNLDTFNGPNKSTVHGIVYDGRLNDATPGRKTKLQSGYLTNHGMLQISFNPQQRLVKELIDEIYRARGSVFMMTDELVHEFVINALLHKQSTGFDVRLIVRQGSTIPQPLLDSGMVRVIANVTYLPTVLISDHERDRNGDRWGRTGLVLNHPPFYKVPFEVLSPQETGIFLPNDAVRIYPSDLFVDGALWELHEFAGTRSTSGELERLTQRWLAQWTVAVPAPMNEL